VLTRDSKDRIKYEYKTMDDKLGDRNKKLVGKKAEPTAEELEFIYSRLGRLSDQEVLEELESAEWPKRSVGFIKRRRKELNVIIPYVSEKFMLSK